MSTEINFDGLVGPTHNYGGLSLGNLASMNNLGATSNPRAAVLQGIQKMRTLMDMGLTQGVLPPHERVHIPTLKKFGFTGSDKQILETAWKTTPDLVMNSTSASAMWTANAATVSPSVDTADGKVHFTAANLASMYHRAMEADFTSALLNVIFADDSYFNHHAPLPMGGNMGDEGAANHGRFAQNHGHQGVELFVYGQNAFEKNFDRKFLARQAFEASQAVARQHGLNPGHTIFAQQSVKAIEAGAFHNDVVSVTNGTVLMYHEDAFEDHTKTLNDITKACALLDIKPVFLQIPRSQVSLKDAINSYLFNSQIVTLPNGEMSLIAPKDAQTNPNTAEWVRDAIAGNTPLSSVHYLDLKQSMRNGGGPACLRLRVVLNEQEEQSLNGRCLLTSSILDTLETWAQKHYRDSLAPTELGDPALLDESRSALDALTAILKLGSIYSFQK